jgi:hypothetical protein
LNIPLGNGETLYGAVIGVPVNAKGEEEPTVPEELHSHPELLKGFRT